MRVFLGGVVAGCLSSAGLLAANSFWDQHPDLLQEQKNVETFIDTQKSPLSQPLQDNGPRIKQVLAHGQPSGGRIQRSFKNHVLEYDCASKVPVWVAEHLTRDTLQGAANRKNSKFKMDPNIPAEFSAKNSDYQGSGWSRGHMTPAGDNKMSQESMDETFFLTNILPQDINNNGGFWNRLEMFCRDLTEQFQDVWVTSGPVFLPTLQDNGKKIMSYEVIGDSEVAVPTHLYKVIVAQNSGGELVTGTFIVPNKPLDYSHHLTKFQVPLEHLERKVGTKFYSNLNREETRNLCEVTGCNLITKVEMDQIIFSSRLKRAGSVEKLVKIWKEIQEREIPVKGKLQDLYQRRLSNLSEVAEACVDASSPAVKRAEVPCQ